MVKRHQLSQHRNNSNTKARDKCFLLWTVVLLEKNILKRYHRSVVPMGLYHIRPNILLFLSHSVFCVFRCLSEGTLGSVFSYIYRWHSLQSSGTYITCVIEEKRKEYTCIPLLMFFHNMVTITMKDTVIVEFDILSSLLHYFKLC